MGFRKLPFLKEHVTKEELEDLHHNQRLSARQIAEHFTEKFEQPFTADNIRALDAALGVSSAEKLTDMIVKNVSREELTDLYVNQDLTQIGLARLFSERLGVKITPGTVNDVLRQLAINKGPKPIHLLRKHLNKERFEDLFLKQRLSAKAIAEMMSKELGVDILLHNIREYKKELGIVRPLLEDELVSIIDKDTLYHLFMEEELSVEEIAERFDDLTPGNVRYLLDCWEVKRTPEQVRSILTRKMSAVRANPDSSYNQPGPRMKISEKAKARWADPKQACKILQSCRLGHEMSYAEQAFADRLTAAGIEFEREFPIVDDEYRFAYDFKVGNTLIEINPSETHNVTTHIHGPMSIDYHLKKSLCAVKHGYRCFHIFDWQDQDKFVRLLAPRKSVYGRKCEVKVITQTEANRFLKIYHIQGAATMQTYCVGLFYENVLVSVMTFGKPRYNKHYEWELIRYASSMNVTGGAKKLWFKFLSDNLPNSVLSYCDFSRFSGDTYRKLGFKDSPSNRKLAPVRHWWDPSTHRHYTDNFIRQRGFDQLFNAHFGKGTDNNELLRDRGLVEVYDCGQLVFEIHKEDYDTESFRKHAAKTKKF